MSSRSYEDLRAIRDRAAAQLLQIPGVHVVAIGGREKQGRPTGEIVLKVFVDKKRRPEDVPKEQRLPITIEGVGLDVVELGRFEMSAEIPGVAGTDTDEEGFDTDPGKHRPIEGGRQISGSKFEGNGTLGFFATIGGPSPRVVGVTCYHIFFPPNAQQIDIDVGQPDVGDSCRGCCRTTFGKFHAGEGHYDSDVDAALVTLEPLTKWKAAIAEIGVVRGIHVFTDPNEVANLDYLVKKRGRTTRLTGGTIQGLDGSGVSKEGRSFTRAIVIKPNAAPSLPAGASDMFCATGDSGAAVLNDDDEIVGLLFNASKPNPKNPNDQTPLGWGAATQIGDVIKKFHDANNIDLTVATATDLDEVRTVPGASARPQVPEATIPAAAARRLQIEIPRTEVGRDLAAAWMKHAREVNHLLETNRRVAVLWHRARGPALLEEAIAWLDDGGSLYPYEIDGRSAAEWMSDALDAFGCHGSAGLKSDIELLRPLFVGLTGRSYRSVLDDLNVPRGREAARRVGRGR